MVTIVTEETVSSVFHDEFLKHAAYNAIDCCVPAEVHELLEPRLDEDTGRIYRFEHACQAPALTMTLRGVLIDESKRADAIIHFEEIEENAQREINQLAGGIWDQTENRVGRCTEPLPLSAEPGTTQKIHRNHLWPRGVVAGASCKRCGMPRLKPSRININSVPQLCHLFYDLWGVRKRRARLTGRLTVDKEALADIAAEYGKKGAVYRAEHGFKKAVFKSDGHNPNEIIVRAANACVKAKLARKQAGYARSKVGPDGRMRSSMHVGAAETGRWSGSQSPLWDGWNIQQIADQLKGMVIADPGLEIGYADLEQAESHIVAYDAGDEAYIAAHKSGDVHTGVCKLVWPELPWTGVRHEDRALAETSPSFDPDHSYRDYAKRIQHGGNMGRTPAGVARQIHIPIEVAKGIYDRMYKDTFPAIKARHRAIYEELQRTGITRSCFGRKRQFLGRTWDDATLREALGQLEQSPVADILNLALLRVWSEMDTRLNVWDAPHPDQPNRCWLLAQVHDAILFLFRRGDTDTLRRIKELMEIPLCIGKYTFTIPVEIAVGPSWAKKDLKKVKL